MRHLTSIAVLKALMASYEVPRKNLTSPMYDIFYVCFIACEISVFYGMHATVCQRHLWSVAEFGKMWFGNLSLELILTSNSGA